MRWIKSRSGVAPRIRRRRRLYPNHRRTYPQAPASSVCFRQEEFVDTRCFTVDVTDKVRAEEDLREAKERLAATHESVLAGIVEVDSEGRFLSVNEAFCKITGFGRDELAERRTPDITHPDDRERERVQFASQVKGEVDHYHTEKRYVRADGEVVWVEVTSSTVQALVTQTARSCSTAAEFQSRFEPRLLALSTAHDRLTRNEWLGVRLAEIVEEELGVHRIPGRELIADGPPFVLPPKTSLSLSLALHELATNSTKYGALSVPEGAVAVTWQVEEDGPPPALKLVWSECGGPAVSPPKSFGFGTRLLKVTAAELGGETNADFAPTGLVWTLRFPLKGA